jgi:hypothetical protein
MPLGVSLRIKGFVYSNYIYYFTCENFPSPRHAKSIKTPTLNHHREKGKKAHTMNEMD